MGRPRKLGNGSHNDILSLLSPARQKEVLDEALGAQVRIIVEHHQRSTFGTLVKALERSSHWNLLQHVSVSTVLRPAGRGVASPTGRGPGRPRGRGKADGALLDKIVAVIEKNPGLRSEHLQGMVGADRKLVKAGLAKLRELKRVKTTGNKRATTYTAA